MMIKPIFALLFAGLFSLSLVSAQPGHRGGERQPNERIEAIKIGMITRELELTAEESKLFWPLYNELREKEMELKRQFRPEKPLKEMSSSEAEAQWERKLALIDREAALQKEYLLKMKEVLPAWKILRLPAAEQEFRRSLMQEMRGRKGNRKKH